MAAQAIPNAPPPSAISTNDRGPHSTELFLPYQVWEGVGPIGEARLQHHDLQTITAMPLHQAFSLEELRLNDYNNGRGVLATTQPSTTQPFQVLANGLVQAHVPTVRVHAWPPMSARLPLSLRPLEYGTSIVFFDVGKENPERFAVHENLIAPRSQFVRLALNKEWKEGKERTIPLPEDEADVFRLYHLWIYQNRIFSDSRSNANAFTHPPTAPQDDGKEYPLLTQAYILGEKLLDTHFKDAIIDCIIDKLWSTCTFDLRLTNLIYENTPEKSPLRRLLQDVYIWSGCATWLDKAALGGECVNAEFLLDLSKRHMAFWAGRRPERVPYMQGSCEYHEHVDGVCCRSAYC